MMAELDFAPGLHGHFLELVLNKYIFGIDFDNSKLFQSTGAAHGINMDPVYQSNKVVYCSHRSSFEWKYGHRYLHDTKKVIFIQHAPQYDIVLLTNIYYRCHPDTVKSNDFNADEIHQLHKSYITSGDDLDMRRDWFAKLDERRFEYTTRLPKTTLPVYFFDYSSFFDLGKFVEELAKTAKFLEHKFTYDTSLANLWDDFMARNQGWNLYQQGNRLIEATVKGQNFPIPNDWKLHAYINFRLSRMFDLYDGVLYNSKTYPDTTEKLMAVVKEFQDNFDNRW